MLSSQSALPRPTKHDRNSFRLLKVIVQGDRVCHFLPARATAEQSYGGCPLSIQPRDKLMQKVHILTDN